MTLLRGHEGTVEIHQEHVGPDQHEAVGSEHLLGANLSTESQRAQAWSQTKTLHYQAKVAIITQENEKVTFFSFLYVLGWT